MSHADEMTCLLYLEGQLERSRALELSAHVEQCPECRALLRALERESRWLERALVEEDEAVPARLDALPAREAVPWGGMVASGFAAAAAYTLWTGVIEPWRAQMSQAGFGETNLLTMLFFGGVFWKGWGAMTNILEIVAMATLGILTLVLLRRGWRRWMTVPVVMGALTAALALPPSASAAEFRKGPTFTLAEQETVKTDLVVSAENCRIDGKVDGDLIFFGRRLTVNGHVTGDVIAFAQFIRIDGPVDGNVRGFGSLLSLAAPVGKNVSAFAGNVELEKKSEAGGGALLFAGEATLDGRINRDLASFTGKTILNGFVGGNAQLRAGKLTIGSSAEMHGRASYQGQHPPEVSSEAKLASPLEIHVVHRPSRYLTVRYYVRQALGWAAAFLLGMLIVLLMPGFFSDVVRSTRNVGLSFGLGAIVLLAGVLLALISVLLLLVGVPVGMAILLLYAPAIYASQAFVGCFLGEKLLGPSSGGGEVLGRLALGLLVIRVLAMIPIVKVLVWIAVILWGVGALTLSLYGRSRTRPAVAAAGPALG
jgi:cytoskeletal protein CcmA (bactofilin family)